MCANWQNSWDWHCCLWVELIKSILGGKKGKSWKTIYRSTRGYCCLWVELTKRNFFWKKWKNEKVEKRSVEARFFWTVEEVLNYGLWVELTKRIFFGKSEKVEKTIWRSASWRLLALKKLEINKTKTNNLHHF